MPFPTVDGKTLQEDLETVKNLLGPVVASALYKEGKDSNELWLALNRLFKRIDVVSTQLYDDVQKLKELANRPSLFPPDDPSQQPL